jgi:hypothetical protein
MQKGDPLDFLTTASAPSKEFDQNPKDKFSGFLTTVQLWDGWIIKSSFID